MLNVTRNVVTCTKCAGAEGCPSGTLITCPVDAKPIAEHATTGECSKGLLTSATAESPAESQPIGCASVPAKGPGTELKKLLKRLGFVPSKDCMCNAMATKMDREGGAWSLENIDIIVDVMRSEAAKRKLPFMSAVARALVKRAVRNAIATASPA